MKCRIGAILGIRQISDNEIVFKNGGSMHVKNLCGIPLVCRIPLAIFCGAWAASASGCLATPKTSTAAAFAAAVEHDPCIQESQGRLPSDIISIRDPRFGAKGDGISDDLAAMQAGAHFIVKHPGMTLLYPKGIYHIAGYRDFYSSYYGGDKIGVSYAGGSNFKILGCSAVIDVNGHFNKSAWSVSDPPRPFGLPGQIQATPNEYQWLPFYFDHCSSFEISGFEINGNVNQMTQDDVTKYYMVEGPEYGIVTGDCRDYSIHDIFVHHMATDGLAIGWGNGDFNGTIRNVTSSNNARQALSIMQADGLLVKDTQLKDTGITGGGYPVHSPGRGVDMEPDCSPPGNDWGDITGSSCPDRLWGNYTFDHVVITGNMGGGFAADVSSRVANVVLRNSVISSPPGSEAPPLELGDAGTVIQNNQIDTQLGQVVCRVTAWTSHINTSTKFPAYLAALGGGEASEPSLKFEGNVVKGQKNVFHCMAWIPHIDISDNTFSGTGSDPLGPNGLSAGPWMIAIWGGYQLPSYKVDPLVDPTRSHVRFYRNKIFLPGPEVSKDSTQLMYGNLVFEGLEYSGFNTFSSSYAPAAGGPPAHVWLIPDPTSKIEGDQYDPAHIVPFGYPDPHFLPNFYPSTYPQVSAAGVLNMN